MGRMADILRNAERRPDARPAPADPPEVEAEEPAEVEAGADAVPFPELEDDDAVPFIEVGGPREPALRIVTPPPPPPPTTPPPPRNEVTPTRAPAPDPTGPLPPAGPFTIAFQPVHAGRLPGRGFGPELIAYHQPDHPVSVQYRSLAAEIARQLPGAGPRVLLFTAASAGAGTSTVLLNLAITLARQEAARVVAVDANVARPALAAWLGVPAGPGLAEARAGV